MPTLIKITMKKLSLGLKELVMMQLTYPGVKCVRRHPITRTTRTAAAGVQNLKRETTGSRWMPAERWSSLVSSLKEETQRRSESHQQPNNIIIF